MEIIARKKSELIKEIYANRGQMEGSAVIKFFDLIDSLAKKSKVIDATRKYFKEVVGYSLKEMEDFEIDDYLQSLTYERQHSDQNYPKVMRNRDVISNLAYYLSEKFLKMKQGVDVKYVRISEYGYTDIFFFFDPELEELFGYVSVDDIDDKEPSKYCKRGTLKGVKVSMTDKEMRGVGLGKNMYLTLVEKFGCLASDSSLFSGSLNIWMNVLPKYYKVYYYTDNSWDDTSVFPLTNKRPDMEEVEYFIAIK